MILRETYTSSDVYTGSFNLGLRHGYGVLEYSKGGSYAGPWELGMKHGVGMQLTLSGDRVVAQFDKGKRDGPCVYLSKNPTQLPSFQNKLKESELET